MGQTPSFPLPDPISPSKIDDFLKSSVLGGYMEQHFNKLKSYNKRKTKNSLDYLIDRILKAGNLSENDVPLKESYLSTLLSEISDDFSNNDKYFNVFSNIDDDIERIISGDLPFNEPKIQLAIEENTELNSQISIMLHIFNAIPPSIEYHETLFETLREIVENSKNFQTCLTPELVIAIERHFQDLFKQPKEASEFVKLILQITQLGFLDFTGYIIALYYLFNINELAQVVLDTILSNPLSDNGYIPTQKLSSTLPFSSHSQQRTPIPLAALSHNSTQRPGFISPKTMNFHPQSINNGNNMTYRVRFGDNAKIKHVCNTSDTIFVLLSDYKIYSISQNGIVSDFFSLFPCQCNNFGEEFAIFCITNNGNSLRIFQNYRHYLIPLKNRKPSNQDESNVDKTYLELMLRAHPAAVCEYDDKKSLLVLECLPSFGKKSKYILSYLNNKERKTHIGQITECNCETSIPVCMDFFNGILTIVTTTEILQYEVVPKIMFCKLLSSKKIPQGEKIVSLNRKYYITMAQYRSYNEFSFVRREDNPYISSRSFSRDTIQDSNFLPFPESCRRILNILPQNFFVDIHSNSDDKNSQPSFIKYRVIKEFLPYCDSIVKNLMVTSLPNTIGYGVLHITLSLCACIVHNYDLTNEESKTIREMLNSVAHSVHSMKQSIVHIIAFILSDGFEKLYRKNINEFTELIKIMTHDKTKLGMIANSFPIFITSPAVVYLDKRYFMSLTQEMKCAIQKSVVYFAANELELGSENAAKAIAACLPTDISNLVFLLTILAHKNISPYINGFLDQIYNLVRSFMIAQSMSIDSSPQKSAIQSFIEQQSLIQDEVITRETEHPLSETTNIRWEISMNNAEAIEVTFDKISCVMLGEHDFLQISGEDGTVYNRDMTTQGPFPESILVNGSKAVLSLHQLSGTRVYGLVAHFRRIGHIKIDKKFNNEELFTCYLLYRLSLGFCQIFSPTQPTKSITACDFLLNCNKLEPSPQQMKEGIPINTLETLYSEHKSHIKVKEDEKDLERIIVSAVLNQLDLTSIVVKQKTIIKVTPPSTPKKSSSNSRFLPSRGSTKASFLVMTPTKPSATIFLPNSNLTQLNQTLQPYMRKSEPAFSQKLKSEENKLESLLSFMMKELYKLRSRIKYMKQKSMNSNNTDTFPNNYLNEIAKKAQYFTTISSVFNDNDSISIEEKKQRCSNFIRLIGSEIPLSDIMFYTNSHINKINAQNSVTAFLVSFINEAEYKSYLPYLLIPFLSFMANQGKMHTYKHNITENLTKILRDSFNLDTPNSIKMLSSISELLVFGGNKERINDILKGLTNLPTSSLKKLQMLMYSINTEPKHFMNSIKLLLDNGMITETFFALALFSTQSTEIPNQILQIAADYSFGQSPASVQAIFKFIGIIFNKKGLIALDFKKNENNKEKIYTTNEFFLLLLEDIGNHLINHKVSIIPESMSEESHSVACGEIISLFRTLLQGKAAQDILILFDNILFEYQNSKRNEKQVIGVFSVVGPGILPFQSGYAKINKTSDVYRVDCYHESMNTISLINSQDAKVVSSICDACGSPRVPLPIFLFKPTKFRCNFIMNFIMAGNETSDEVMNTPLYSIISLFLMSCITQANSEWKNQLLEIADEQLVKIAVRPTYEAQYHSIPELIQACSMKKAKKTLSNMERIAPSLLLGNSTTQETFYFEFKYTKSIKSCGFIDEYCSNEYQSSVSINFETKTFGYSTTNVALFKTIIEEGDIIGVLHNHDNQVIFFQNHVKIGPRIPLEGITFSPFIISYLNVPNVSFDQTIISELSYEDEKNIFKEYNEKQHSKNNKNKPEAFSNDDFDNISYNEIIKQNLITSKIIESNNHHKKHKKRNTYSFDDYYNIFKVSNSNSNINIRSPIIARRKLIPKPTILLKALQGRIIPAILPNMYYKVIFKGSKFFDRIGKLVSYTNKEITLEFIDAYEGSSTKETLQKCCVTPMFSFTLKNEDVLQIDNIWRCLSIRCLRVFCMKITLYNKHYSHKLLKYLIPTIITSSGKVTKDINFLNEYMNLFINKTGKKFIKKLLDFDFNKNIINKTSDKEIDNIARSSSNYEWNKGQIGFAISYSSDINYRWLIDYVMETTDGIGFIPSDVKSMKIDFEFHLRLGNKKTNNIYMCPEDFNDIIEGKKLNIHLSLYRKKVNTMRLTISPLFKFASDSYYTRQSFSVNYTHSLIKLLTLIDFNKMFKERSDLEYIAKHLNNFFAKAIISDNEIIKKTVYKAFWFLTLQSNILDYSRMSTVWLAKYSALEIEKHTEENISIRDVFSLVCIARSVYNKPSILQETHKLVEKLKEKYASGERQNQTKQEKTVSNEDRKNSIDSIIGFSEELEKDVIKQLPFPPHEVQNLLEGVYDPSMSETLLFHFLAFLGKPELLPICTIFKGWMQTHFHSDYIRTFEQEDTFEFTSRFPASIRVMTQDNSELPNDCIVEANGVNLKDGGAIIRDEHIKIVIKAVQTTVPPLVIEIDTDIEKKKKPLNMLISFYKDLEYIIKFWPKSYDEIIAQSTGDLKTVTVLQSAMLENAPEHILSWKTTMIKSLNSILSNNFKEFSRNPALQPLIQACSHVISPDIKFKQIEKLVCKNLNDKMNLRFNRTAAALMKTNPNSPHAISLFDQFTKQVASSSLASLKSRNAPWVVDLIGEGAIDAGGPGREIFTNICEEIFLPFNHLFIQSPNTRDANLMCEFLPDPRATTERLIYAGSLIGLSFVTQSPQPFKFHTIVWNFFTGISVKEQDVIDMDTTFAKVIQTPGDKRLTAFSVTGEQVSLSPHGDSIEVDENTYRRLAMDFRIHELTQCLKDLRTGFEIIMGQSCRKLLSPMQLKMFICGPDEVTAEQIISRLHFMSKEEYGDMFEWVIEQLTPEERSLLLKFITGRVSIPISGSGAELHINVDFCELKEQNPPFGLPNSATCSSTILLPRYPTRQIMLERVRVAIREGSDMVLDGAIDPALRAFE